MTHARIPDFSQPVPVLRASQASGARRLIVAGRYIRPRDERLPGEGEAWRAVAPVRPDTPHSRAPRFLDIAGEAVAAVAIIGGGIVLTGLASLL